MTTACATPTCLNAYEPWADDGDGPYRTEDTAGLCATCATTDECACCGDRFENLDSGVCPDCRSER